MNCWERILVTTAVVILLPCFVLPCMTYGRGGERNRPAAGPQVKDPVYVYTPRSEMYCASDPRFLDSSPLVSPANFLIVEPGTELVRVGFGGVFSSRMYWKLSAGGRESIYVYRDVFDSQFVVVRKLE